MSPRLAAAGAARPARPARASRALGPAARAASRPHAARLGPARRELAVTEAIWRALERTCASVALVRFAAGGGCLGERRGAGPRGRRRRAGPLARRREPSWRTRSRRPVWARYGSFRGQPPITATLRWSVAERSITLAGSRGSEPFAQTSRRQPTSARAPRDTSPVTASRTAGRVCERCGKPIAQTARAEAALLRQTLPPGRLARPARARPPASGKRAGCAERAVAHPVSVRPLGQRVARRVAHGQLPPRRPTFP